MKILVTGSRHFTRMTDVKFVIESLAPDVVVHGRALGADFCAHMACEELGIAVRPYPADWTRYGTKAGSIRNQQMLDVEHTKREPIDVCLAFPLKDSIGTWDMIKRCVLAGIPVEVYGDEKAAARYRGLVRKYAGKPSRR